MRPALVGCGPRRGSPGRVNCGRPVGAPVDPVTGRRWKIGWPRTTPPRGRPAAGATFCAVTPPGLGGGAWYTGRGPVCGVITRRCGTMGCCAGGFAAIGSGSAGGGVVTGGIVAGGFGCAATGGATGGCCAGGVTITAGGAAGFSGTGGAGAAGLGAAGVTTAVFSTGGAGGVVKGALGATTVGFSGTGGGPAGFSGGLGATVGVGVAMAGRVMTGRCCCSSRSRSCRATSPGLCTLEKSILGSIRGGADRSREGAEEDLAAKCLLTVSAS